MEKTVSEKAKLYDDMIECIDWYHHNQLKAVASLSPDDCDYYRGLLEGKFDALDVLYGRFCI